MHTGPVVISRGGGADVEIFGDTPNVAARVQSVARADTVFITGSTQRLVAGIFVVEELGAHTLKGVPEPVPLYRVLQPSGVRSRLDVVGHRFTPFVGRDLELGVLLDRWERVEERDGQSVVISGEAGVGKSRLMHTLRERLADAPHTWLECRCTPYTQDSAFRPVIELVEQGLAFAAADAAAEKIRKLETALERSGFLVSDTVPLFSAFLSVPLSDGYTPLQLSPDLQRKKTIEALVSWTLALGELQPLLLLVEDLHWCDPSSLELLGRLIEQSRTTRMMMLCTARPEFQSPWPARANLTLMQLNRLTKRQAREMVAALSPDRALSPEVVEAVVTRADGIPLYVEEVGRMVLESGLLREREGRYELSGSLDDAIPTTLQDSLMARLDRLSAAKDVAQRAAVLGREFAYALLAAIAGIDEPSLRQGLAQLVEADLLFQRGEPPEATYTFKHALIQDAAYQSLLKRARQQLHARVVEVLVALPERLESDPGIVARHAEAAGRIDDAIAYYQRAGEAAKRRSAHEEAIGQLRTAIRLLEGLPETAERDARESTLQIALAASLQAARGYAHEEYGKAWDRAGALAAKSHDQEALTMALLQGSLAPLARGDLVRADERNTRALAIARARRHDEHMLLGCVNLGISKLYQGHVVAARKLCEQSIALYDPVRDADLGIKYGTDGGVSARSYGAWALWFLGHPDQSAEEGKKAIGLARTIGHPHSLAFALIIEASAAWTRRDLASQRALADEAIALSKAQGFPLWLGLGRAILAGAAIQAGDAEALAALTDGLALAGSTGLQAGMPAFLTILAEAQAAVGRPQDALSTIEMALTVAAQTTQPFFDAELHRLRGEIVLQSVDNQQSRVESQKTAEECFHRALDIAHAQEAKSFELRTATSLARLWRDQDRRGEGRAVLAPLYAWFTEGFDTRDLKDAKAVLEELGYHRGLPLPPG
jgi:tetratricopeptide (TPR) repeat protein